MSHSATGRLPEYLWRVSNWDHRVHAFRQLGEVSSTAVCSHSALTNKLTEDAKNTNRCLACVIIVGGEMADRGGEPGRYQQEQQ